MLFIELLKAIASRQISNLKEALTTVDKLALTTRLHDEVTAARALLESLLRIENIKKHVLAMDKSSLSELRNYNNPPSTVLPVVQAMLLLLGSYESFTKVETMLVKIHCTYCV